MRPKLSHAIILVLIAFGGLFYMKFAVEEKEEQLSAMKAEYLADQKALRVLKAEWAYLNSPEYLQSLFLNKNLQRPRHFARPGPSAYPGGRRA